MGTLGIEEVIRRFITAQNHVIGKLYDHYGVDKSITAFDWAFMASEMRAKHRSSPIAEIFRVHGNGLEFKDPQVHIDYDYSGSGRPNGFDDWRLLLFVEANGLDCIHMTHEGFNAELKRLQLAGVLDKEPDLYFLAEPS